MVVSIKNNRNIVRFAGETLFYMLIFTAGYFFSGDNNLVMALIIFLSGIASYIYYAITRKNILDLRAVFFSLWLICIGIAQIRLSEIQVPWSFMTWLCFFFAVIFFNLGFFLCELLAGKKIIETMLSSPASWKKVEYKYHPKRAFHAALFIGILAVVMFLIQIKLKGFIPIFVPRYDSYILFYNRFAIFVNLIAIAAPLAYWSYKNLNLTRFQRIMMLLILPLPTIIFQMAVQRGLFILGICYLAVPVLFFSKRKALAILGIAVLAIAGILFSTAMRNIPAESMQQIWRLKNEITFEEPNELETPSQPNEGFPQVEVPQQANRKAITVPSILYTPYYYCINGLENFNHMVNNIESHSLGVRQLSVLSVILRFDSFKQLIASYPSYKLLPSSTACIITDFYYDFGIWGVIIESILWGSICSFIQQLFLKTKRAASTVAYGVCLFNCAMSFFAAWLSYFSTYLFGGACLLVYLYINFSFRSKKQIEAGN